MMFSKCFCYNSSHLKDSQLKRHHELIPLSIIFIRIDELVASYVSLSVTFKRFTSLSCLSVCLTRVEGIHLLSLIKREVTFDLIKKIQTGPVVMITDSLA